MKILIRRWIDNTNDTLIMSNSRTVFIPIAANWSYKASCDGASLIEKHMGMVIVFSKAENLYSHNTPLSAKEINKVLKLKAINQMAEDDEILINTKYTNIISQ